VRGISLLLCLIDAFLFLPCKAHGQSETKFDFEVASLKPLGPLSGSGIGGIFVRGGPGTSDPGQFTYRGARLRDLVFRAYGLIDIQQQIVGPEWIDMDRFDLAAKIPPGTTKEQFQQMLQNLLADRFKLAVHHETKVLQVYELVPGKNGPKLGQPANISRADNLKPASSGKQDRNGFPVVPTGFSGMAMHAEPGPGGQVRQSWVFGQESTSQLAGMLSNLTGRLTVDKTGMTGKYDFILTYDLQQASATDGVPDAPGLTVFDAVEQQLGLRLVDAKDPFDLVVIDRVERVPADN
jgi:uncharacterized protein (TIGR03435 family)